MARTSRTHTRRYLIFALVLGLPFLCVPQARAQNECSAAGNTTPIPGMAARDGAGIVHQTQCIDAVTGRLVLPFTAHVGFSGSGAPTCAVTGAGTGATCTTLGNFGGWSNVTSASPLYGQMAINSGTTPAALGTLTLTFSAGTWQAIPYCIFSAGSKQTTLDPRFSLIISGSTIPTTTNYVLNWDNNAVSIGASQNLAAFYVLYVCMGL